MTRPNQQEPPSIVSPAVSAMQQGPTTTTNGNRMSSNKTSKNSLNWIFSFWPGHVTLPPLPVKPCPPVFFTHHKLPIITVSSVGNNEDTITTNYETAFNPPAAIDPSINSSSSSAQARFLSLVKIVSRNFETKYRTLWCQIRTARSLLRPLVLYPPWFFERGVFFHFLPLWFLLGPRFSVSAWWCFYEGCGCSSKGAYLLMFWRIDCVSPSLALLGRQKIVPCTWAPFQHVMVDRVFLELTLEVFIRGEVFTFHPLRFLFGAWFFKMLHKGFYCDESFKASHTPVVFIWTTFFRYCPMRLL